MDQAAVSELDRRYRAFVETLPPCLVQLARNRSALEGTKFARPLQTVAEFGVQISGPWVLGAAFPDLTPKHLLDLGESWLYLAGVMLLDDHVIDGQLPATANVAEFRDRLMVQARDTLCSLVGERLVFWQRFEHYQRQVTSALELEVHYRSLPQPPYDLAAAWYIGTGKSALFKTIPWAMVVLSNDPTHFARLEASLDAYAASGQLLDDVADWQEDLARGHCTYPLVQAGNRLRESGTNVSPQAITSLLWRSTLLTDLLTQAEVWYRQALAVVHDVPCPGWIDFLNAAIDEYHWYRRWLIIYQIARAVKEGR